MTEADLPAGTYLAFRLAGLAELPAAWEAIPGWLAAHREWRPFCSEEGCECADHPGFELYPPEFGADGEFFIYVPVAPRG